MNKTQRYIAQLASGDVIEFVTSGGIKAGTVIRMIENAHNYPVIKLYPYMKPIYVRKDTKSEDDFNLIQPTIEHADAQTDDKYVGCIDDIDRQVIDRINAMHKQPTDEAREKAAFEALTKFFEAFGDYPCQDDNLIRLAEYAFHKQRAAFQCSLTVPAEKTVDVAVLREKIGIAIGEASMCWSELPTGVFDSERATRIVEELFNNITEKTK